MRHSVLPLYRAMKPYFSLLFLPLFFASAAGAQTGRTESRSGVLYFAFGSHEAFYSKSDIFLTSVNPDFSFTLGKVRASDDRFLRSTGGAPQYDYQVGYYFKKKNFGIEYNFDHVKYFMRQYQVVPLKGTIEGVAFNQDTLINPDFIQFEHSDGANYALLNFVKWKQLVRSKSDKASLDLLMKAGAGPVIPKTNSRIMGKHRDDRYKIAGYVVAVEAGLRYNFLENFFIEPSFKGAFANYKHFLIADGYGSQKWFSAQLILLAGVRIGL
jgi:hypothetical protein